MKKKETAPKRKNIRTRNNNQQEKKIFFSNIINELETCNM